MNHSLMIYSVLVYKVPVTLRERLCTDKVFTKDKCLLSQLS